MGGGILRSLRTHSPVHNSRGLIPIDQQEFATTTVADPLESNLSSVFQLSRSVFELPSRHMSVKATTSRGLACSPVVCEGVMHAEVHLPALLRNVTAQSALTVLTVKLSGNRASQQKLVSGVRFSPQGFDLHLNL